MVTTRLLNPNKRATEIRIYVTRAFQPDSSARQKIKQIFQNNIQYLAARIDDRASDGRSYCSNRIRDDETERPSNPRLRLSSVRYTLTSRCPLAITGRTDQQSAMSVVDALRQNDPARTSTDINLSRETSDADLAQALEQNQFITDIGLDMREEQRTDWDSLLRVIATRANLEYVDLKDERGRIALVRSILRAMQQNTAIRRVKLTWLLLPTDIFTFVDDASSIKSFELYYCDGGQGARDLAAAIQRNTNIERLVLYNMDENDTIPILEGLGINTTVKTFIFCPSDNCDIISNETSHALQQLLESTTSIERFELQYNVPTWDGLFQPIAQAITNSETVSELKLSECIFEDRGSLAQLQSILQNKQNLTSLCLDDCNFGGGQIHEDMISLISRPGSLLRCFEFESHEELEEALSRIQFENLLQAVQTSKLERFKIGTFHSQQHFPTLTRSIPSMKLKELEVGFYHHGEFDGETIRQDLLHAVKNNFSLQSLKGNLSFLYRDGRNLFESAEDKQRLAFYANRNESLDQWVDNPQTIIDRKVWPEALGLAERAGQDALFRGLRSVLERDYVCLPGGRKRK